MRYFFKPKATLNYPFEKGPLSPALPRRACAAPLSERRGALHRLQALRGDLPGAGDHHRGRAARRRHAAHDALRHRHGEVHLLRLLPGGLPGGRHRRGAELRVRHRDARGALLRQGPSCSRTATAGSAEIARNLELDAPYRNGALRRDGQRSDGRSPADRLLLLRRRRGRCRGVLVVFARNPVHSVLFLILAFFTAAGLFVLLGRRVPGDAAGRRLRRRGRGAVPVRGDDARRRLRRAARRVRASTCRSGC